MIKLLAILRNIVWPSILSVVFASLAILVSLVSPGHVSLAIAFGTSSIAFALLAQRA